MRGRSRLDRQRLARGPLRQALLVPDPERLVGARVLVVDDVLTEGSTLREVARALRLAGAEEVAGLVLARPVWTGRPGPGRPGGGAGGGGAAPVVARWQWRQWGRRCRCSSCRPRRRRDPGAPLGAYRLGVQEDLARVSVSEVRVAVAAGPGVEAGLVTLREDEPPYRSVPIIIGQHEARAIHAAWTNATATRPSTWDLFVSTVGVLGARLDRVVITAVEDHRHFFSDVEFEGFGGERRVLAARPSDAIALALRAYAAGIYVVEKVFADLGLPKVVIDN